MEILFDAIQDFHLHLQPVHLRRHIYLQGTVPPGGLAPSLGVIIP